MSEPPTQSTSEGRGAAVSRRPRWLIWSGILAGSVLVAVLVLTMGGSDSPAQSDSGASRVSFSGPLLTSNTPSLDSAGINAPSLSASPEASVVTSPGTTKDSITKEATETGAASQTRPPTPNAKGVLPDPVAGESYEEKQPIPTVESATVSPPAVVPFDEATAPQAAEASLRAFIQLADQSYQSASIVPALEDVGGGFALGEVQTGTLERWTSGVRQVGNSVLVSIDVVTTDLRGPPPQITLRACLDSSSVDALDAAGSSLKASMYNPGHPVLNLYGVQHDGQAWKVTTHDIPEDQTACGG